MSLDVNMLHLSILVCRNISLVPDRSSSPPPSSSFSSSSWNIRFKILTRNESGKHLQQHDADRSKASKVHLLLEQRGRDEVAGSNLRRVLRTVRPVFLRTWDHRSLVDSTDRKYVGANGSDRPEASRRTVSRHLKAQVKKRHTGDSRSGEKVRCRQETRVIGLIIDRNQNTLILIDWKSRLVDQWSIMHLVWLTHFTDSVFFCIFVDHHHDDEHCFSAGVTCSLSLAYQIDKLLNFLAPIKVSILSLT